MTFDYKYLIKAVFQHMPTQANFRWGNLKIYTRVVNEPWKIETSLMFYNRDDTAKELITYSCNEKKTDCNLLIDYDKIINLYTKGYKREMKIVLDAMTEYFNNELKIPMKYILRETVVDKSPIMIKNKWFVPSSDEKYVYDRYEDEKWLTIHIKGKEYIPAEIDEELRRILQEYFETYVEFFNIREKAIGMGYKYERFEKEMQEILWTLSLYSRTDIIYDYDHGKHIVIGVYPNVYTGEEINEVKRKYSLATRIIRDVITARMKEIMAELELLGQQVVTQ
jgi:hypothetical protein